MERKSFQAPVEVKQDEGEGIVRARFATLNVVDHGDDVTLPGAFGRQEVRMQPFGHDLRAPLVGKGIIFEEGDAAIFEGRLNLESELGRETWAALKFDASVGSRPLVEWSYVFDVEEAEQGEWDGRKVRLLKKLRVHSVDPVFLGEGVGTATLAVKEQKTALPVHHTEVVDRAWDGPAAEAAIPNDATAAQLRQMYAWRDPDANPDTKSAYRFIHHHWSGGPGPANVRACITGIAVLNGARGGTTIPASDRRGVWRHLAAHLEDADREPPPLREASELEAVEELHALAASLLAVESKEGRVLSEANRRRISQVVELLDEVAGELRKLLAETDPKKSEHARAIDELYRRGLALQAELLGVGGDA